MERDGALAAWGVPSHHMVSRLGRLLDRRPRAWTYLLRSMRLPFTHVKYYYGYWSLMVQRKGNGLGYGSVKLGHEITRKGGMLLGLEI